MPEYAPWDDPCGWWGPYIRYTASSPDCHSKVRPIPPPPFPHHVPILYVSGLEKYIGRGLQGGGETEEAFRRRGRRRACRPVRLAIRKPTQTAPIQWTTGSKVHGTHSTGDLFLQGLRSVGDRYMLGGVLEAVPGSPERDTVKGGPTDRSRGKARSEAELPDPINQHRSSPLPTPPPPPPTSSPGGWTPCIYLFAEGPVFIKIHEGNGVPSNKKLHFIRKMSEHCA